MLRSILAPVLVASIVSSILSVAIADEVRAKLTSAKVAHLRTDFRTIEGLRLQASLNDIYIFSGSHAYHSGKRTELHPEIKQAMRCRGNSTLKAPSAAVILMPRFVG